MAKSVVIRRIPRRLLHLIAVVGIVMGMLTAAELPTTVTGFVSRPRPVVPSALRQNNMWALQMKWFQKTQEESQQQQQQQRPAQKQQQQRPTSTATKLSRPTKAADTSSVNGSRRSIFSSGLQPKRSQSAVRPAEPAVTPEQQSQASAGLKRRQVIELGVAATGLLITAVGTQEVKPEDYGLWGVLPVGPYKSKKTIRETIIPDQLWTLDQKFGILNVQVPLRMTIVKLNDGLLVYNPIAATAECVALVKELVQKYGPIRHIIVGSVALEHKVYAGVFARKFPTAQVWLTPGQYSFPVNLPDSFLGFPPSRTRTMPRTAAEYPADWKDSGIQIAILGPILSRDGAFAETVLLHQPTKTLLVTDTAVQVTDEVPAIYDSDLAPLLYHARDTVTDIVTATPETLRKGWRRVVLFGLYFTPSAIRIKDVNTALAERRPDINSDFAGVYPWDWVGDEEASWKGLTGTAPGGKPLVAPILQTLLLNRNPVEVLEFADRVASWDFDRIIPAHLKNNLRFSPADYRAQFGFLEESGVPAGFPRPLAADLQTLLDAEQTLLQSGAIAPAPPKVGGAYSRAEIIQRTTYRCRAGGECTPKASAV